MVEQNGTSSSDRFRKNALRNQKSGERLDSLLVLVGMKSWFSLLAILLLISAVLLWAFQVSFPDRISGEGMLLPASGIRTIVSPVSGRVSSILVGQGDSVIPGACVARIGTRNAGDSLFPALCPVRATILAVQVCDGDSVSAGDVLFSISTEGNMENDLQAVIYFDAEDGQRIETGMQAGIDPVSTDREDYGYILGEVSYVSDFPVSETDIAKTLGTADIAHEIASHGPSIEVRIDLLPDSTTFSGYAWSSRHGPEEKLHAGILCSGEVALSRKSLLQLIFPDIDEKSRHSNP